MHFIFMVISEHQQTGTRGVGQGSLLTRHIPETVVWYLHQTLKIQNKTLRWSQNIRTAVVKLFL